MKKKVSPKPDLANPESSLSLILAIIAGAIGFLIYINTVVNGYVLDDNIAIIKNLFVQEGFSGIPKLFTIDFWYFENLKLGYYRPLGLVTFAIEHEFFGNNPQVSHFDNALLYGLTGFILCLVLIRLFTGKHPAFAFLASLIFIAHPIHTEVVANIKSRDEILSFLNMIVMIYFAFKYISTKKAKHIIWSMVFFYLALLSKETAVVGIVVLPLFFYYTGIKITDLIKKLLPYAGAAILFFMQKNYFLGSKSVVIPPEIINYPYSSHLVKIPTVFHIFVLCLERLIFPWPLSHDYSYNQVPASHWSDVGAIFGLIVFITLAIIGINGLLKKSILGLGISLIFITLIPSLAFVFLRGGIMAERFLYAPCLGFAILIVYGLSVAFKKAEQPKASLTVWMKNNMALTAFVVVIFMVYSIETVVRNIDWKDERTLYAVDSKNSPNSCQVHKNYGYVLLNFGGLEKDSIKKRQEFDLGLSELQKAVSINPDFGQAYSDIGFGYQVVEINLDSAIKYYKKAIDISPNLPEADNNLGVLYQNTNKLKLASYYYNMAVAANPQYQDAITHADNLKKATGLDVHEYPADEDSKNGNKPADTK